ncbi:VWA domain-containing protein [Marinilabilia salmonicolor]|jgi:Ca-activated chloride channel family protein|uniref:Ca-activated chloride channel family protein n=1 Tax=Marinilabilia salmonicolor TaxID=989 RepID=A0A2T0X4J3_9BACT|nr:VWA domain-containing protein [Marinilabilia salmonicolor]PRY93862.1 Ca-activated chloride channel family protein [Marinilabilia salmonicolor]RCW30232.1 Ca-activated chloride channel family protein [Marinilabilia salmonicolor]
MNYTFLHPYFFYLLLLLIPLTGWYIWKQRELNASLQISSLKGFSKIRKSRKTYLRHVPFGLRCLTFIFLTIALARPQSTDSLRNVTTEGIDIIVSLDVSGSMLAMDFEPNRLEAAKDVATDFISGRPNDKMGLVIFAAESFTQCPLTIDHAVLTNLTRDVQTGILQDGTAIGLGLSTAVSRIKDSDAKSKVIILLTDGVNNRGEIHPLTAAEIAKSFGIRVYTIGVGSHGTAPYPVNTVFGQQVQDMEVKIDEEMLREIANTTGGQYFRATDKEKLRAIYEEIDQMEKTKIEVKEYSKRTEEFIPFALLALAFLLMEILLRNTILRNLP